jgi:hypothetical protein
MIHIIAVENNVFITGGMMKRSSRMVLRGDHRNTLARHG